jgi:hypothetical protein
LIGLFSPLLLSQVIWEDSEHDIYKFLEELGTKGIIKHDFFEKPLSRKQIAFEIKEAEKRIGELTEIDKEDLNFYKKEYFDELKTSSLETRSNIFVPGETGRIRAFSYRDTFFTINADPILALSYSGVKDNFIRHRENGLSLFGSVSNNIGFNISYVDNQEFGNYLDTNKFLLHERGNIITKILTNQIQYDEVRANLSYGWNWGSLTIGKDYMEWGSGQNGQLILSDKAPAFPFIKLEMNFSDWFKFVYLHGWLYSGLLDSSTIHQNVVNHREGYTQREKYIAAHFLSMDITKNLNFTLGESIIYSDKLEFIYLIPVMFFRGADHYLNQQNSNTGANAQLWANSYYKIPAIKTRFYGTLFIDELSLTGNFSAIGYTVGGIIYDPVLENSSFIVEYTKISPFVYMNTDDAQHYTSYDYVLGHWIGSNADQIYFAYTQKIIRGLESKISLEYTRKGQTELPDDQYKLPYPMTLYGSRRVSNLVGLGVKYEIIHSAFVNVEYTYSDISDQQPGRTYNWELGKNNSLSVGVSYGL